MDITTQIKYQQKLKGVEGIEDLYLPLKDLFVYLTVNHLASCVRILIEFVPLVFAKQQQFDSHIAMVMEKVTLHL